MKSNKTILLPALALALIVPSAWAEQEVTIRRVEANGPQHVTQLRRLSAEMEKETVAYLGVETAPVDRTLSTQLGLARDTGLVVSRVAEKSPAADVLKRDDILTRFEDQILVNPQQLGVLVRSKKEGDEVKLTVIRGGKETTVKAKLATHEVPKVAAMSFFHGGPGNIDIRMGGPEGEEGGMSWLGQLPGMDPEHARDVLRMIGREKQNVVAGPRMHIIARHGKGSTLLDLPNSNISYSDDEGAIEIKSEDKQRSLTLKDAKGNVTFSGPINTPEERAKLPAEVKSRLEKLDGDNVSFEPGADFKPEVVPLPGEGTKTKISRPVESAAPARPLRSI